jgi:hypothetical protein
MRERLRVGAAVLLVALLGASAWQMVRIERQVAALRADLRREQAAIAKAFKDRDAVLGNIGTALENRVHHEDFDALERRVRELEPAQGSGLSLEEFQRVSDCMMRTGKSARECR